METGRELAEADGRPVDIRSEEAPQSLESQADNPADVSSDLSITPSADAPEQLPEENGSTQPAAKPSLEVADPEMDTTGRMEGEEYDSLPDQAAEAVTPADPAESDAVETVPPVVEHTDHEVFSAEHEAEHAHEEEHGTDEYETYTVGELVGLLENLLKESDTRPEEQKKADVALKKAKAHFDQVKEHEKQEALLRFLAEGGTEDDFEFRSDAQTQQFEALYRQLKEKKVRQLKDWEKSKEKNLAIKQALLESLRHLVDSEESRASIDTLKDIQKEWKASGAVASQQTSELWASYHALLERYYANRSIYFELKELDRRKNLEAKAEICDKAEKLALKEPSNAVIKELNELHEEYRHIGPVPKEEQEAIWQRFKLASDAVYGRRRGQMEVVKKEMEQHYQLKTQLVAALQPFIGFDSQKINEWNEQTQAILDIQKQWNAIGPVSKEKAKEISKQFWHDFKTFFHHKNDFFKKLEEYRAANLQRKIQLCEQVEALLQREDVEKTSDEVKKIQQEWKNVGPVPEKQKNQVFDRFKAACDGFFNRRRESRSETDRQYEENLVRKTAVCEAIEEMARLRESDVNKLAQLKAEWSSIGYVPRNSMQAIGKRYMDAIHSFAQHADKLSGNEKEKVKISAEVDASRNNPAAFKNLQGKETGLRKKLMKLENDIALWKNNIEFFSRSKTAEKLREEFNQKISEAEKELAETKYQIKLIGQL